MTRELKNIYMANELMTLHSDNTLCPGTRRVPRYLPKVYICIILADTAIGYWGGEGCSTGSGVEESAPGPALELTR